MIGMMWNRYPNAPLSHDKNTMHLEPICDLCKIKHWDQLKHCHEPGTPAVGHDQPLLRSLQ